MKKNVFYAQSGGVTAVINASACGVIETARKHKNKLGKRLRRPQRHSRRADRRHDRHDGGIGAHHRGAADTRRAARSAPHATSSRASTRTAPSTSGSSRSSRRTTSATSSTTAAATRWTPPTRSRSSAQELGYPIVCIGVPKTVDNDLPITDTCPGFGSVAKYVAVSTREAALDVASMARTSTRVFVLEVMGRHAGWIAAAGGLAGEGPADAPHVILFPEIPFDEDAFLARVKDSVAKYEYCVVVVSEGAHYADGRFLAEAGGKDAFGHAQLGGVAATVAQLVKAKLGFKYHYAIADYLQRAARHIASKVDVEQAYAMGKAAVELALKGENAVMPTIVRKSDQPYRWGVGKVALAEVANKEKMMPRNFITRGRLRHHGGLPPLFGAADPGRGLPALQERPAELMSASRISGLRESSRVEFVLK